MNNFDITNEVIDILKTGQRIVFYTIDEVAKGNYDFSEIQIDISYMSNLLEQAKKNKKIDFGFVEFEYNQMMKEINETIEKKLGKSKNG